MKPTDKNYHAQREAREAAKADKPKGRQEQMVVPNRADHRRQWKEDGRGVERMKPAPFDWDAFKRGKPTDLEDTGDLDATLDEVLRLYS
jgi:hypothetical protein